MQGSNSTISRTTTSDLTGNKLWLGKVHLVEWLRPGDRQTGWELFGELQPIGIMSRPEVDVQFWRASTRAEFVKLLRAFEDDLRTTGRIPALHIETHGNDDGIGVSDTEGISFPDLMEELILLNQLTRLNLFVFLAACEGAWGIKMLQPTSRAAYRALIGPNQPIDPDALAKASTTFYRTMFRDRSADTAFRAMNDAIDATKPTFSIVSAEMAFMMVYRQYLKEPCTEEEVSKRVEGMVAACVTREHEERGLGTSPEETERARAFAREHITSHSEHFQTFRKQYFFIDLYPENAERFDITIEECRRESQ